MSILDVTVLDVYMTAENLEAAERLLEKYLKPPVPYSEQYLEYVATLFLCELCDLMTDDFDWFLIERRTSDYYEDDTENNLVALISGLRHARLAYIADKDNHIRVHNVNVVNAVGDKDSKETVLLFTEKSKTNIWMSKGDVMHETGFEKIMKMCVRTSAEYIVINPSRVSVLISISDIEQYSRELDEARGIILEMRQNGLEGEDLLEPLLMSFDDCPVACDIEGACLTGTAFVNDASEPMSVTIASFSTDDETTVPVDKIKRLRVIQP
ncbi:MAG: hypothetical protein LUD50_05745 [Clostridia bacterium]|nr:hypothetical protein [Clostridia bacterium]